MLIKHNGVDVKLPDFLIVGAAKSGTTSLHYYLKQHPDIFMPNVKELWFYCFMDALPNYVDPWWKNAIISKVDDYLGYFKKAKITQVIGEICPVYLYFYDNTIKSIKKIYGDKYKDVKIIIILRNPAERAWSHFMMHRRDNTEPIEEFKLAIQTETISQRLKGGWVCGYDYTGFGMYYEQVKAFMEEFNEVKIFLYDEMSKDPQKVVKEIFEFVGVSDCFIPDTGKKYNISGDSKSKLLTTLIHHRYPLKGFLKSFVPYELRQKIKHAVARRNTQSLTMPIEIRKELVKSYKDNILKLEKLIGKDLSGWITV